jgi:LPXTG-motif cell wall-anchored protein
MPPKTAVETHLTLTGSQNNVLLLLFVIVMPALVIGLGVWVYLKRRR